MPNPPTDAEIRAALEVCKRATPGPWISVDEDWDGDGYQEPVLVTEDSKQIAEVRVGLEGTAANQEFIALARTLLPRVLTELLERRRDSAPDNYVAWMRYIREGGITRIVTCDSDAAGAFQVYRRASIDAARKEPK